MSKVAFRADWFYGNASTTPKPHSKGVYMEKEFDFVTIDGKGYTKNLFSHLNLQPNSQVSIFEWHNGESPWHDHSVDEITFVSKGEIEETRIADTGERIVKVHKEGTHFIVPAGTLHKVRSLGYAHTVNICDGDLQMKTYKEEDLPVAVAASAV